ncbi:MAG: glycosyltransferase [Anaerolineales bacterium]|nr:glycosyltransferase [Anaerolineales bacterium]
MDEKLRIAHFSNTYHPVISGVVRSVSTFRKALSDLGYSVFVFAQDASDYQDEEPFIFRYPTVKLGLPHEIPATIPISPFIDKLFPSLKVDVIHSHHPILVGQAAAHIAEKYELPLVFTYHSRYHEYSQYLPIKSEAIDEFVREVIRTWLDGYMSRCQHIVAPSESIRQQIMHDHSITSSITVIPTGIDVELFRKADGKKIRKQHGWDQKKILFSIGRLVREKNWDKLLEALKRVVERHSDVKLVLIGDGDERENLENYAQDLGIINHVEFLGKIPFNTVPDYFKAADLFCFASRSETQGLVTMEAMSAGLPIIAVDGTGTRDVVSDGIEGLLTEDDGEALAKAICWVLEDGQLASKFKLAAEKKANMFAIEEQAKALVNVYREAMEARKANLFVKVHSVSDPAISR